MLWDPIRYAETCPSSDGACAHGARAASRSATLPQAEPAGVDPGHRDAQRADDVGRPRPGAARVGGARVRGGRLPAGRHHRSAREIDAVEMYVPFSWFEPMWLENLGFAAEGEGWRMVEDGATQLDGDLPVNMSGGVLSSNPIGASGMLRFAEAAMQVRGTARASTRSTAPAPRWATPTAAARSSSPCGSSASERP